jgi:hypothetical protein
MTIQHPKEKGQKGNKRIKHYSTHKTTTTTTKDWATQSSNKTEVEPTCSWSVNIYCSTSDTRRATV